jgi:hypothetical protein
MVMEVAVEAGATVVLIPALLPTVITVAVPALMKVHIKVPMIPMEAAILTIAHQKYTKVMLVHLPAIAL